jgi:hypothetical protein
MLCNIFRIFPASPKLFDSIARAIFAPEISELTDKSERLVGFSWERKNIDRGVNAA